MRASGQTKHRGVEHGAKRSQLLTGSGRDSRPPRRPRVVRGSRSTSSPRNFASRISCPGRVTVATSRPRSGVMVLQPTAARTRTGAMADQV